MNNCSRSLTADRVFCLIHHHCRSGSCSMSAPRLRSRLHHCGTDRGSSSTSISGWTTPMWFLCGSHSQGAHHRCGSATAQAQQLDGKADTTTVDLSMLSSAPLLRGGTTPMSGGDRACNTVVTMVASPLRFWRGLKLKTSVARWAPPSVIPLGA